PTPGWEARKFFSHLVASPRPAYALPHHDAAPQRVHHALQLLARRRRGAGSTHPLPRLVALTSRADRHLAAEPAHELPHLSVLAFPDRGLVGARVRAVLPRGFLPG